ncbi:27835_t:CDS:2 [Gigaspora margarita]|uniref:27835_t:CDS:1 n=1 Tax=Gigaspora margarita TaxID=4874 RepID=A0ABN7W627_GIGMA|nr:27835_t:CDS:2 [Gigaspora margarita]
MEIEKEEDLASEQEVFQAAMQKHAATLKVKAIQIETIEQFLWPWKKKSVKFNDWYNNTNNWPIEKTVPASEECPELVTKF